MVMTLQLPLSPFKWATLQAPQRMTSEEWERMMAVLEAMKPAIVDDGTEPYGTEPLG